MSNFPEFSENQSIEPSNIRKVWHKGEWHYCVVDMIAELLEVNHKRAKSYWSTLKERLKKEGNESVTKCDLVKIPSSDGKQRLTDVVNTEQALRLIQSIPSPKAEPMKLWLANVGMERIQEAEDPELAFLRFLERSTDKYRLDHKPDSWIVARIEGMVARKACVEALKRAVIDALPTMYAQATEKLYVGLWNRTTSQLRGELNLKKSENPRDHFGEYALIYTRLAEKLAAEKLGDAQSVTLNIAMEIVWSVARHIRAQASATAQLVGYDLVT